MEKSVIDILNQPFNANEIKERPGSFGKTLSYVEGHAVVRRLNKAFNNDWSFEVVSHTIIADQLVVHGRISVGSIIKEEFGGKAMAKKRDGSGYLDVASDFKAAATDALKKCATLLGVGLDLYGADESLDEPKAKPADKPEVDTSNVPATAEQKSAIEKIAKSKKLVLADFLKENSVTGMDTLTQGVAKTLIVKLNNAK